MAGKRNCATEPAGWWWQSPATGQAGVRREHQCGTAAEAPLPDILARRHRNNRLPFVADRQPRTFLGGKVSDIGGGKARLRIISSQRKSPSSQVLSEGRRRRRHRRRC
jgi:hypothetical protein